MPVDVSDPAFWQSVYERGDDGWELGGPAPPLVDLLADPQALPREGRVAVVGCGRGHDARLLARSGYSVWGFDFAPRAIEEARRLASAEGLDVQFERRDVFSLPEEFRGAFDIVWEYTCFCAIDPGRRDEYVDVVHRILAPGGTLVGLFYPIRQGTEDHPPFPMTEDEVRRRLEPRFRIGSLRTPARSVPRRQGNERLVIATPL